jgi:hypothetical protein
VQDRQLPHHLACGRAPALSRGIRATISAGGEPTSAAARRRHRKEAGTLAELFTAYAGNLRAAGKRSADFVEGILDTAAEAIGSSRPAAEVTPGEIVPHLATVRDRAQRSRP